MFDVFSEEVRRNPYPFYHRLREEPSVSRTQPFGYWGVSRHSDVLSILRKPQTFLSAVVTDEVPEGPEFLLHARTLIGSDPPDHTRLRALVSQAFTPLRIEEMEGFIRQMARELLDDFARNPDFIEQFATPFPVKIISRLLGIDPGRYQDFKRWSDMLISWRRMAKELVEKESVAMHEYFSEEIRKRQQHPSNDLISALVRAREAGDVLSSQELMGFIRLLLVAGNETTTNLLGNAMLVLGEQSEIWERLRQDRSLVPSFIEEVLRFDSPTQCLTRRATSRTEVGGMEISKDDVVLLLIGSANHDESVFENPEKFLLERKSRHHLSFGGGIHFCLGAPLARLQARVAFEEFLERYSSIEILNHERLGTFFFRGLSRLKLAIHPPSFATG